MENIGKLIVSLVAAAKAHNYRRALVLAGDHLWCLQAAQAGLAHAGLERIFWISAHQPEGVQGGAAAKAHQSLGREVDALVLDAYSGFDVDAFGITTGALRGGGLLLLLTPPLAVWPRFNDPEHARIVAAPYKVTEVTGRFLQRLVRVLVETPGVMMVEQGKRLPPFPPEPAEGAKTKAIRPAPDREDLGCRTEDQRRAVEALVKVVTGQRRRPVVLTSDRGRGKSAALGIAAAYLLQQGTQRILVTGPRLEAVDPVFKHARRLLPHARDSRAVLQLQQGRLEFIPPDELVRAPRPADLLLVDEAAAIPTPLLEHLLHCYSRLAFATTIHGYEGTGRGFALRFYKVLDTRTRGWKALRLETPIRWSPQDPVEHFVFRALLLEASAAPDPAVAEARPGATTVELINRDTLVTDEATLSELFGLLVLAHYQTRPYDLRHLLDGPNLSAYIMRYQGHVIATALIAREGGFDAEAAWDIWAGRIRPHGHLLPESLAAHLGLEDAPRLHCARIMRLAVHPAVQGRGLGTALVAALVEQLGAEDLDYLGSSFGATRELLHFWKCLDFLPVRLSVKRGAASGAHSALVLRPLSQAGVRLAQDARACFLAHFPHQLSDPLRDLEPGLAASLLHCTDTARQLPLDRQDWQDVVAFASGQRIYEVCLGSIWKLACAALADPATATLLGNAEREVLIVKVLQKRSWQKAAVALRLSGRAQVVESLRQAFRLLIGHFGDAGVRREAERLSPMQPLGAEFPAIRMPTQEMYKP